MAVCRSAGARDDTDVRATSLSTLLHMVAGGMGITLLPSVAVSFEAAPNPDLVVIPFRAPVPRRTIALAWRANAPRREVFEALADMLADLP